jgi:hypothetical protein
MYHILITFLKVFKFTSFDFEYIIKTPFFPTGNYITKVVTFCILLDQNLSELVADRSIFNDMSRFKSDMLWLYVKSPKSAKIKKRSRAQLLALQTRYQQM